MDEFEAPFKDKMLLISAYDLIELLIKHGVSKPQAIIILDTLINTKEVVVREIKIPHIKFRQIHRRKTKGKSEVHIQIPREQYPTFKIIMRKLLEVPLFTITKSKDDLASKIGSFNAIMRRMKKDE